MQSEIPQLQVVTAIGDAESEDYIAQLLFSQGWNIVYRAFDMAALLGFFEKRSKEMRTVLVFKDDLSGFDSEKIELLISPTTTMINLSGVAMSAHSVMSFIRSQLRLPLIVGKPNSEIYAPNTPTLSKVKSILVSGTPGAPGKSTIAINLALSNKLPIYDFDFKSPSIEYLISRSELDIKLLKTEDLKPREFKPTSNSIIDLGNMPSLGEMVNDRRWHASLINSVFESASQLIFVVKASGLSLLRLEKFIKDFPILLRKIPIIYTLNQAGNSREERALERKFLKMVEGESSVVIPYDVKVSNPGKSENKSIGKLVTLVN